VSDLPTGTVTLLFTDIEGSTRLLDELGDRYQELLERHHRILRQAIAANSGVEVDTEGDAFFCVFERPEDALGAAGQAQSALAEESWPKGKQVRVRMGMHTGTPAVAGENYIGIDVHRAARIAAAGHGGQVVISRATKEELDAELELRDLGEHRLKDFAEPVWLFQLGEEEFPPLRTLGATNLPRPASSFVGRESELREIVALLRSRSRVVTLTGAGGSGKTRLALEAAFELVGDYPNGTYWVGLAQLRDPALVMETIAQSVGAKEELAGHFAGKHALLLLDNFEQVVEAARPLSTLLSACAGLDCLVTSRELLRITGERECAVPPLADPEAVDLFCERSGLDRNEAVAELCRRLDKLPLALELAAARTNVLSPAQILERLGSRLDLLRGGRDAEARHTTLRATIVWSYELLTEEERRLFARLSVFSGGCTLVAAEEVADADLETLQSLVEKSLVRHTGERFWMLETIREFALERFEERAEAETLRKRHGRYFLDFVEGLVPLLLGPEEPVAFEQLHSEHDNLRTALRFTLDAGDIDSTLRLATVALQRFWRLQGHLTEGRGWLEEALANGKAEARLRAMAFRAVANIANQQRDPRAAIAAADQALSFFRAHGDVADAVDCLNALGGAMLIQGDLKRARAYFEESERLGRGLDDTFRRSAAIGNLGNVNLYEGTYDRALAFFEQSVALSRELDLPEAVASSLANAGLAALHLHHYDHAEALFRESVEVANRVGDSPDIVCATEGLGVVAAGKADWKRAVKLLAGAQAIAESIDFELEPFEQRMHERAIELVRTGLGAEQFDAAWAAGAAMTQAEVISNALAVQG
jgi:predicted ATPase/class 3 adenylate cyclase